MRISVRVCVTVFWLLAGGIALAQQEWPVYGSDPGNSKYSSLRQINKTNVARLKPAWIYHTGDVSDGTRYPVRSAFEATPLVVDGVMYVTTAYSRLIALDAETVKSCGHSIPKSIKMLRITCSSIEARRIGATAETGGSF